MKIIAESAFNHNGDVNYLLELAKEAKETNTDYFTVQVMSVPEFCTKDYSKYLLYKENTLDFKEWNLVFDFCKSIDLNVIPCVLDLYSLEYCYNYGMRFFKLHATDITNIPMLEYLRTKEDVLLILETQCATSLEINFALEKIGNDKVECLIHGFSNYPTEVEDLNLNTLDYLRDYFPLCKVGLADHSLDVTAIPLMALAKGCEYLEKHITLSRNNRNFDYQVSLYPYEFSQMVSAVRHYQKSLGQYMKHPVKSEMPYRTIMYKKYLGNNQFKRANEGQDYMSYMIDSFKKKDVGIALIARLKSKRLKEKILQPLHDTFMLDFLYKKLHLSKKVKKIFLATSPLLEDKSLVDLSKKAGYNIHLGHPVSVLDRMLELCLNQKLGSIFRVTGDNPFTDIKLIDQMIDLMLENDLDYVRVNGVPFGVSGELFSTKYLWKLYMNMENPMSSEYLTLFVLNDNDARKGCIDVESSIKDMKYINLSVDYQEDLDRVKKLLEKLGDKDPYAINMVDLVEYIDTLDREDKNKIIKLPNEKTILFSDFLAKLENQNYIIRQKNKI